MGGIIVQLMQTVQKQETNIYHHKTADFKIQIIIKTPGKRAPQLG